MPVCLVPSLLTTLCGGTGGSPRGIAGDTGRRGDRDDLAYVSSNQMRFRHAVSVRLIRDAFIALDVRLNAAGGLFAHLGWLVLAEHCPLQAECLQNVFPATE